MNQLVGRTLLLIISSLTLCCCAHAGIEAASRGDVAGLKAWLAEGGQIESRAGTPESTALLAAARNGQPEAITFLLSKGADANAVDEKGDTALCIVMKPEKAPREVEVAQALASGGADVNKKCQGQTPLHYAAANYKWDAAIPLLQRGAVSPREYSKAEEPLSKAALSARADVVALMLKNGVDPNLHGAAAVFDALNTPQKDSYEVVKLLVEKGAKVREVQKGDGTGDTALHRVVLLRTYGSSRLVDILVRHGADPYAINQNQQIPLDTALDKSKQVAARMIRSMAVELPGSDPLKKAYDKMVMAAVKEPMLGTIERMIALAGYSRVQARLVGQGAYDQVIQKASKKKPNPEANRAEASVYAGFAAYAAALVGALANAAAKGDMDRAKVDDAFNDLMKSVKNDTEAANESRVRKNAGESPAAVKVQAVVKLLRELERESR